MNCYLCGAHYFEIIARRGDMRFGCFGENKQIVKCGKCGLIQLLPQWTERELDELYSKYWQKEDFKGQKRKVRISKHLTRFLSKKDWIIEVGCGMGDNVKYLQKKGYKVTGIDKDPGAFGTTADYKDYDVTNDNVIYAVHLFEHLADPRHFIRWMKGKRFILEMPNTDEPLLALKSYRKFYWYPYHHFFYTPKTIKKLFPDAKIILRQEYGIINHLRWAIFGKPGNWNPKIPIIDSIYEFILTKIFKVSDTLIVVGNA